MACSLEIPFFTFRSRQAMDKALRGQEERVVLELGQNGEGGCFKGVKDTHEFLDSKDLVD